MKLRWFRLLSLVLLGVCVFSMDHARASRPRSRTIVIDEFGHGIGTRSQGFLLPDPGPGGRPSVLTYVLPFAGTRGDVVFSGEAGLLFGGDVTRFNGNGTVLFYSDNIPTADSPADTPGPPLALYPHPVTIPELGLETLNAGFYTPLPGQPGFDPSNPNYIFVSDGTIPGRR
jgi:hypothetical protein